jgi:DNA-binding transcriptional regulator LsrR (DeoR family)
MAPRIDPELRDELVFAICERFFKGEAPDAIAARLNEELDLEQHGVKLTRERIYPLIREGVQLGYVVLSPPVNRSLSQRLLDRYNLVERFGLDPSRVRVVGVRGKSAAEHLAAAGAEVLLALIRELGARKEPVHLGLGSGWTTMLVARRLVQLMRQQYRGPGLVLHALSSGFDANDPLRSPVAFFGPFQELPIEVSYVGLFASAAVSVREYDRVKKQPGVRESFERAREIDIVVSSLASARDEHGALNRFIQFGQGAMNDLRRQGWVGDVQYLPLSRKGPIRLDRGSGIRAVTLFELPDFVHMVESKEKYVVLVAGPCGVCGRTKEDALRPLLEVDRLRIWSHLVTDAQTADRLLNPEASSSTD